MFRFRALIRLHEFHVFLTGVHAQYDGTQMLPLKGRKTHQTAFEDESVAKSRAGEFGGASTLK
jgi:hypothetical protein